jgi:hypothetical protein
MPASGKPEEGIELFLKKIRNNSRGRVLQAQWGNARWERIGDPYKKSSG